MLLDPAAVHAARPAVVVFGGGAGPDSNQASIEAQVELLAQVLKDRSPRVLFAAGSGQLRSVQVDSDDEDPAGELLGLIFGRRDALGVDYRATRLEGARPANRTALVQALLATRANPNGSVFFGAGHGEREREEQPARMLLWNGSSVSSKELAENLDGQTRRGALALVLGHCYSGAFTAISHVGGDASRPLATPPRCVLAAVPPDREASGCTPDLADPSARSFLRLVAEALGPRAEEADFDRDGKVSLLEAHAFARVHDETVDIPVTSSEVWLRSAFAGGAAEIPALTLEALLKEARPTERAVLTLLRPKEANRGIGAVETRLSQIEERIGRLDAELRGLETEENELRAEAQAFVLERWPELGNPFHRVGRALLGGKAEAIEQAVRTSPVARRVLAATARADAKARDIDALERSLARIVRWLRAAENVKFELALRRTTPSKAALLDGLLACEGLVP